MTHPLIGPRKLWGTFQRPRGPPRRGTARKGAPPGQRALPQPSDVRTPDLLEQRQGWRECSHGAGRRDRVGLRTSGLAPPRSGRNGRVSSSANLGVAVGREDHRHPTGRLAMIISSRRPGPDARRIHGHAGSLVARNHGPRPVACVPVWRAAVLGPTPSRLVRRNAARLPPGCRCFGDRRPS
jgi:hypothetical protein